LVAPTTIPPVPVARIRISSKFVELTIIGGGGIIAGQGAR
jgi:hypothetical protein